MLQRRRFFKAMAGLFGTSLGGLPVMADPIDDCRKIRLVGGPAHGQEHTLFSADTSKLTVPYCEDGTHWKQSRYNRSKKDPGKFVYQITVADIEEMYRRRKRAGRTA